MINFKREYRGNIEVNRGENRKCRGRVDGKREDVGRRERDREGKLRTEG